MRLRRDVERAMAVDAARVAKDRHHLAKGSNRLHLFSHRERTRWTGRRQRPGQINRKWHRHGPARRWVIQIQEAERSKGKRVRNRVPAFASHGGNLGLGVWRIRQTGIWRA